MTVAETSDNQSDQRAGRRPLRLRPLTMGDEAAVRSGQRAMAAEDFTFALGLEPGMSWPDYLKVLQDHHAGVNLPGNFVPNTFLAADVNGEVVGRTSIRHRLNESLAWTGGHIGYGVLPGHRRRGYATEILRQSLVIARAIGVDRALLTCDADNAGSIAVIEACGGKLSDIIPAAPGRPPVCRYWID
jgi:predicted acetyltransferase